MNILFICNQGKYRGPTAAKIYKEIFPNDEVKYLGIFTDKNIKQTLDWANKIYLMEDYQLNKLLEINDSLKIFNKTKVLSVEDIYKKYDPKLIKILKEKFENGK